MQKVLITGAAGFIGFFLAKKFLDYGWAVLGLDSLNNYYDVNLKLNRLKKLGIEGEIENNAFISSKSYQNFKFIKFDISGSVDDLAKIFSSSSFDIVIHLAAQAGVRYSIENPKAYIDSNVVGFFNILECLKNKGIKNFIFASSSSVYGNSKKTPFSVKDKVDYPASFYAATKKSNELMAHVYSYLYDIKTIGLRFFTVYGPMGRPDMAYFKFAQKILKGEEIEVYNYGKLKRDFTYIDDIIESIWRLVNNLEKISFNDDETSAKYKIYNIGANSPINVMEFIFELEKNLKAKAKIKFLPMQPGDVEQTYADCEELEKDINYKPIIPLHIGLKKFVDWFLNSNYATNEF